MLEKTIPASTQIKDIKTEDGILLCKYFQKNFINKKLANVTKLDNSLFYCRLSYRT